MNAITDKTGDDPLASFHQRQQHAGESFHSFYTALVQLLDAATDASKSTTSTTITITAAERDALLRDAIVRGLRASAVRDQLHRIMRPDLTLANAVALCRMTDLLRSRSTDTVHGVAVAVSPSGSDARPTVAATTWGKSESRECVLPAEAAAANGTKKECSTDDAVIENPFAMEPEHMCGITGWHPRWLQKFANTKSFLIVYGLLGTIQSMAFLYFVVTLTTIEKRFKIPSYTTGIVISGNEISQILLSLVLSYAGGQRNRPRWIAWGVVFCSLSCFILALPHFIYGPGEDALHLTEEYLYRNDGQNVSSGLLNNITMKPHAPIKSANKLCTGLPDADDCDESFSYVPLVLIFLSQFVLGIGTTLYYTLGQTYLDDNTKKTNTPMMLAYAMSLRMLGPVVGFLLGFVSLRMYIDPWRTPVINHKDPRWLGAWWFGWILLGFAMMVFSWLIGMFPKELPKQRQLRHERESNERPRFMRNESRMEESSGDDEEGRPFRQNVKRTKDGVSASEKKGFFVALMRLLRNKLLMFNILSSIFYILGSSGSITFLSKYMEVQFNKNASEATIVTGPLTLLGMVIGFLFSGWLISKYRPGPRRLFFWNVLVGMCYIGGQFSNLFLTCDVQSQLALPERGLGDAPASTMLWNLTTACNANCACDSVPYSPVCDEASGTTYFSPCHAGCNEWNDKKKVYEKCACDGATPLTTTATLLTTSTTFTTSASTAAFDQSYDEVTFYELDSSTDTTTESGAGRSRRAAGDQSDVRSMLPGACMAGCAMGFYIYTGISCLINWLGATGRIGNILLNFRAVRVEDKSFSQGLALMLISLFALIPGPILYGYIIDRSCLIWNMKCGQRGNCQLYDARQFRYYLNLTAMSLTAVGVIFDVLVWWYGKDVDLYGEAEAKQLETKGDRQGEAVKFQRRHQPISPLMVKKA